LQLENEGELSTGWVCRGLTGFSEVAKIVMLLKNKAKGKNLRIIDDNIHQNFSRKNAGEIFSSEIKKSLIEDYSINPRKRFFCFLSKSMIWLEETIRPLADHSINNLVSK